MKRICKLGIILSIIKTFAKCYFPYQTLLPPFYDINGSIECHTKDWIHLKDTQILWNCMIERQILQNSQENICTASDDSEIKEEF